MFSLLPKTSLRRTVVSKNIKESISRKAWNEDLPLMLAVSKKVNVEDLQEADKIKDTNELVVVKQVGELLDKRLKASTNITSSLFQAFHSNMNGRLHGGFLDVQNKFAKLIQILEIMLDRTEAGHNNVLTIIVLAVVGLCALLILLCSCCLRNHMSRRVAELHGLMTEHSFRTKRTRHDSPPDAAHYAVPTSPASKVSPGRGKVKALLSPAIQVSGC